MAIKAKKIFKIILGVIIFFTLPSLLFFGFVYFKYAEDLPQINPTEKADILAYKMLEALDYEAYKNTDYIEFTFKQRHKYQWNKLENTCNVFCFLFAAAFLTTWRTSTEANIIAQQSLNSRSIGQRW